MYGMDVHILQGTMVEDPVLRKNGTGDSYCFFRIAVNYSRKGPDGNREKKAKFFDCSASKGAATLICQAHKGDIVGFRATMRFKDPNTVEKDGVKYVYHDVVFNVAGDLQLIYRTAKSDGNDTPEQAAAPNPNPNRAPQQPAPAISPESPGEEDMFSLPVGEEDVVNQLPF